MKDLIAFLKFQREARGLTLRDVTAPGASAASISQWENDKYGAKLIPFAAYAGRLGYRLALVNAEGRVMVVEELSS